MEVITGTAGGGNPQRGWNWPPNNPIALEPGGVDLHCTVTVAPGGGVEVQPLDSHGVATGGWTTLAPGEQVTVAGGGHRIALRPQSGSAAVVFAWSGTALAQLAKYQGRKGSTESWG